MLNLIKKHINSSDKKRTITKNEFNSILKELKEITTIEKANTEIKENYKNKAYYYRVICTTFPTFPQFIGGVHAEYGRNIEIETYYCTNPNTLVLYFRGNSKEVKNLKNIDIV